MIAQKSATTAAALRFDRAKHVGEIARIVTRVRHDARAQQVCFSFIFAAEPQEGDGKGSLR